MKIRMLIYTLLSVIAISARSQDSEFSGKITNNKSQPISNSSVYLLNTNRGTSSDAQGNYSFKKLSPGKYEIQISSIGYATLSKEIVIAGSSKQSFNFRLADAGVQLEAVLVSAEKKEAFLQKIPLSITAISSHQVKDYRLWNSHELTAIVPNLYSASSGDERNVTGIRGIATTSYDPAVATYIDGVNQFSLDTYIPQLSDIERIEVLRGPQGTLYGRNAMGGVINIITKQPGNKLGGFAEINIGNYNQQRYYGGIRGPIVRNKLFIGLSFMYDTRDGYYKNTFYNNSFDRRQGYMGNYYLKFLPNTKWSFVLNAKFLNNRNHGAFPLVNGKDESFAHPFVLSQDALATMIDNSFNSSLSVNYTGRKLNFSSQTAYQSNYRYYDKPLDGDFSEIDGVTVINNYGRKWNNVKVITEELKFTNAAASISKLKWTIGTYLFLQDNPSKQAIHFGKDALLVGAPDINFSTTNTTKAKNSGIAFFGQATYAISNKLNVIAGLRYDHEKKKYDVLGQYQKDPDPAFDTRPDTSASAAFNAVSPKLGLSYNINKHSDAFVTYSRGYRTGGLTALTSDPSQPPLYPYKPEYSNNIELGFKNNLLGNRLQFNLTAFLTYVTDAQVPTLVLPDAVTITKNAGKLTSKGIELELAAKPVKGLQVDYNFGYTDATYKNLKLSQYGSAVDLDGMKQIFTPESTSLLALQYSYSIGKKQLIKLVARGEWFYIGKEYFDLSNSISQMDHSLFNVRFGVATKYAALMFWARNLSDKKYIAYAYDFGAIHLGDPKTIGVTLSANF